MSRSSLMPALLLAGVLSSTARADLPAQWESGGFRHEGFEVGTDSRDPYEGKPSIRIRSTPAISPQGEANAATGFFAEHYRGKRVRFSAFVKTADVSRWSGLWLSIAATAEKPGRQAVRLRFDNMRDRPVKGTTGWARYQIVVDVPAEASDITLGCFLVGPGTLWMAKPSFEVVGNDVPVTSSTGKNLPPEPQLDLDQR
jgi:hypothetical protein